MRIANLLLGLQLASALPRLPDRQDRLLSGRWAGRQYLLSHWLHRHHHDMPTELPTDEPPTEPPSSTHTVGDDVGVASEETGLLGGSNENYKRAIYIIVTPSTKWSENSEVKKALASEKQWLVLHMTIIGFETKEVNPLDTLLKVVDEGAASTALNDHKWHPKAADTGTGKDSSGANRITIKSGWLTAVASNATGKGLTNVKSPDSEGRWHITIGDADPDTLRAMVLDSSTKFSLGLAVSEEKDGHLQVQYATHERCLSGEPALPKLGPCAKALT